MTKLNVRLNNPFRTGWVETFSDGEQMLFRTPLVVQNTLNDKYHVLKSNQDLSYLAWYYYNESVTDASKLWWVIADANNIENPLDLSGLLGQRLVIPDINKLGLRF